MIRCRTIARTTRCADARSHAIMRAWAAGRHLGATSPRSKRDDQDPSQPHRVVTAPDEGEGQRQLRPPKPNTNGGWPPLTREAISGFGDGR